MGVFADTLWVIRVLVRVVFSICFDIFAPKSLNDDYRQPAGQTDGLARYAIEVAVPVIGYIHTYIHIYRRHGQYGTI